MLRGFFFAKYVQMKNNSIKNLKLLGSNTTNYPSDYSPDILEAFSNTHKSSYQWVTLKCPEFTSLCPKTGQPDFAQIIINYIPDKLLVESKSIKLYLFSFRNHGDFHENCVQTICNDLYSLMKPHFIEVIGQFTPRGGISIHPYSAKSSNTKFFKNLYLQRMIQYQSNRIQ